MRNAPFAFNKMTKKHILNTCITWICAASIQSALAIDNYDCIVTPSKVTEVTAATPGRLASVLVDRSDEISAGDVIAELDSEVERAALAVATARANMKSEIQLGKINYAFGAQRKERLESLNVSKVASNQDLDDATRDAALAAWNLQQAKDLHHMRRLERTRAEAQLKQRTVTSPITGVVLERYKNVGEFVEDQPIIRIAQLDPLHIETIVPIEIFGQIKKGDRAELILVTNPNKKELATVDAVDRIGDAAAGTFGVRLELPNPEGTIPAGVKCQIKLRTNQPAQAESPKAGMKPSEPLAAVD